MAKPTYKFPFSSILGKFGRVDASRGRDPGISADLFTQNGISVYRAPQNKATSTSPAVQARSKIYCGCDEQWKFITTARRAALPGWWIWAFSRTGTPLPAYQTWMKGCLASYPEMLLLPSYCWIGRYQYTNQSYNVLPEHTLRLAGIPWSALETAAREVWALNQKGHIDTGTEATPHTIAEAGIIQITVSAMGPGEVRWWDVYART